MFDGSTTTGFDVTVDIPNQVMPPGVRPHEAVHRVRKAVEAIPRAGWVSVDYSGSTPPSLPWIVLYEPGRAVPLQSI